MNIQLQSKQEMLPGALINGHWCAGSAGLFEVRSPETREVLHQVGRCSTADVDEAIAAASSAFPAWAATSVNVRGSRRVAGG